MIMSLLGPTVRTVLEAIPAVIAMATVTGTNEKPARSGL
jgi:hypothetical protein